MISLSASIYLISFYSSSFRSFLLDLLKISPKIIRTLESKRWAYPMWLGSLLSIIYIANFTPSITILWSYATRFTTCLGTSWYCWLTILLVVGWSPFGFVSDMGDCICWFWMGCMGRGWIGRTGELMVGFWLKFIVIWFGDMLIWFILPWLLWLGAFVLRFLFFLKSLLG